MDIICKLFEYFNKTINISRIPIINIKVINNKQSNTNKIQSFIYYYYWVALFGAKKVLYSFLLCLVFQLLC